MTLVDPECVATSVPGSDAQRTQRYRSFDMTSMHRASTIAMVTLSLAAALLVVTVAGATILSGERPGPPHDEGTAARVFQLLGAALVPATLLFVATAERPARTRAAWPLALARAWTRRRIRCPLLFREGPRLLTPDAARRLGLQHDGQPAREHRYGDDS
jgi:hypothetical protein